MDATFRKITVVIADDHSIMRDGLISLLEATEMFSVLGMVEDGEQAVRAVREFRPDVLLTDITMPKVTGLEAIASAKRASPTTRVVVLTFHEEPQIIHAALEAGADSYVLKDDRREDLFRAIESVAEGKSYLSPSVAQKVVSGYLSNTHSSSSLQALTQREREVLKLIAEGYRTREIAEKLSLSPKTIEKHRANLMRKLDLHNVSEVTTFAIQNGIVD